MAFKLRTGRDYTQSNLRTSLRSYVTDRSGSKQYRTISAVRFIKSFRSDAGDLASLGCRGLSVGQSLRSANGRDLLTHLLTHTIKSEDLTPFLRN